MIDMIYTVIFSNKHAHAIAEFNVVEMSKLASYPFDSIYFNSWTFAGIRESFEIAVVKAKAPDLRKNEADNYLTALNEIQTRQQNIIVNAHYN